MFKQTLMGTYKDGKRTLQVEVSSLSCIDLSDDLNMDYHEFNSLEDLNEYLMSTIKAEPLIVPERVAVNGEWVEFKIDDVMKCFAQNTPKGYTHCVTLQSYTEGEYLVFLWESNYTDLFYYLQDCLRFVDIHRRNPQNDLEVCAYTMAEHGATGMDAVWRFSSLNEAYKLLTEHHKIPKGLVTGEGQED